WAVAYHLRRLHGPRCGGPGLPAGAPSRPAGNVPGHPRAAGDGPIRLGVPCSIRMGVAAPELAVADRRTGPRGRASSDLSSGEVLRWVWDLRVERRGRWGHLPRPGE